MNVVDEFTARLWVRREHKLCPRRGCEKELALKRERGCDCLWCPRHGRVFDVGKAA
jgi:hypothetical protein